MEKTKIILDCDPGHDDAVAIMLAAREPSLELLGVSVVAGNQTLENTQRNASGWARIVRFTPAVTAPWCATR